jgi:hypothetical protein
MTSRPDRLTELLLRLREAYEIGSPLIVQQRLLADFCVCVQRQGNTPPRFELPLSEPLLTSLELTFSRQVSDLFTTTQ